MPVRVLTVDSARTVPPFNVAVRVLTVDSALTAHPYTDTYSFLCTYLLSLLTNVVCTVAYYGSDEKAARSSVAHYLFLEAP